MCFCFKTRFQQINSKVFAILVLYLILSKFSFIRNLSLSFCLAHLFYLKTDLFALLFVGLNNSIICKTKYSISIFFYLAMLFFKFSHERRQMEKIYLNEIVSTTTKENLIMGVVRKPFRAPHNSFFDLSSSTIPHPFFCKT